MFKPITVLALAAAVATAFAPAPAVAQDAKHAIEYRQANMKALGGHMAAIAKILKQQVDHTSHAAPHAKSIANIVPLIDELFPEGSGEGETDALPAIWNQPEKFDSALNQAQDAAVKLGEAAQGGDLQTIAKAFQGMGKACKNCHEDFRKEEDEKK